MKPSQQFFALLRFQARMFYPIWIFPIFFSGISFRLFGDATWRDLDHPLLSAGFLFLAPLMVSMSLFSPELQSGRFAAMLQNQQNLQGISPDFLLTRAIDRPAVFRSKMALFWLTILLPVVGLLVWTAWHTSLSMEISLQPPGSGTVYLKTLPGAAITKTTATTETIISQTGRLAIAGVVGLISVVLAAFSVSFIFALTAIKRLKFKRILYFMVLIVGAVSSPFLLFLGDGRNPERLILLILTHPIPAAGVTGLLVAAAWMFSAAMEKRIQYP